MVCRFELNEMAEQQPIGNDSTGKNGMSENAIKELTDDQLSFEVRSIRSILPQRSAVTCRKPSR
jgi:hypothetical protein